jgi:hypothetical protein
MYLLSYKRQAITYTLLADLLIFLVLLHLELFSTLVVLIYTKPIRLSRWADCLLKVESLLVITFCLLTLGTLVSLILNTCPNCWA